MRHVTAQIDSDRVNTDRGVYICPRFPLSEVCIFCSSFKELGLGLGFHSIHSTADLSAYDCACLSVCLSVCLCVCVSVCESIPLSVSDFECRSIRLFRGWNRRYSIATFLLFFLFFLFLLFLLFLLSLLFLLCLLSCLTLPHPVIPSLSHPQRLGVE